MEAVRLCGVLYLPLKLIVSLKAAVSGVAVAHVIVLYVFIDQSFYSRLSRGLFTEALTA